MASLQIISTLLCPGLPRPITLLLNRAVRDLLPMFSRPSVLFYYVESNHTALIQRQPHANVNIDTDETFPLLATGSSVVVQKDEWPWTHGTTVPKDTCRPPYLPEEDLRNEVLSKSLSQVAHNLMTWWIIMQTCISMRNWRIQQQHF